MITHIDQGAAPSADVRARAAFFGRPVLAIYDALVLGLSCRFVWKCPAPSLLDWYNGHVSANHLDVGVGTGYFLDRCHFPSATPRIVLADLSESSLAGSETAHSFDSSEG
jgi:hypothetical protein